MSSLLAVMLMQYVVSVRAGLVNHVQGNANVIPMETVRAGHSIRTGLDGYAEVLLTPGSFLRVGENSQTVLEGVEFDDLRLAVLSGSAIIEADEINKNTPIHVVTGNLEMKITRPGVYRFEGGLATVIEGKIDTENGKQTYAKGLQVFYQDSYRSRKAAKNQLTSLDVYSHERSAMIARANYNLSASLQPNYCQTDCWLYSSFIGMYTYIPRSNFRSPYGYHYYVAGTSHQPTYPSNPNSNNSGGFTPGPIRTYEGNSTANNNATEVPVIIERSVPPPAPAPVERIAPPPPPAPAPAPAPTPATETAAPAPKK